MKTSVIVIFWLLVILFCKDEYLTRAIAAAAVFMFGWFIVIIQDYIQAYIKLKEESISKLNNTLSAAALDIIAELKTKK